MVDVILNGAAHRAAPRTPTIVIAQRTLLEIFHQYLHGTFLG